MGRDIQTNSIKSFQYYLKYICILVELIDSQLMEHISGYNL